VKKPLLTFLILSLLSSVFAFAIEQDTELAKLYARYAWNARSSGNLVGFSELTAKGFEYDSTNPDILCFRGLESMKAGLFADAEKWFSKSYYSGYQTEQVSSKDVLGWLFEVNYRLGKDREIDSLYNSTSELTRDDPDILFFTSLSLYRLGKEDLAFSLAASGVYRYQDQRFLILLSSWSDDLYYPGILSEYVARQGIRYPDLMARTILTSGVRNAESLAGLYVEQFNDLNSWYFKTYIFHLPFDAASVPDFSDSTRVWPLVCLQKYIETRSEMGDLMKNLSHISLDSTSDGIADFFMKAQGHDIVWELDPDQDGIINSRLVWDRGNHLKTLEYRDSRMVRTFHYYHYPSVDRITLSGPERNLRDYNYLPGSYEFSLSDKTEKLHISLLFHLDSINQNFIPESEILKNCFSLIDSVTNPGLTPFREYTVIDGMIRRFREDSNFDGNFDRVVLLNNWLPYEGYRDIDGDGVYDLREKYSTGRFSGFIFEGDNTTLEEYHDLWNKKRYQLWDFSKDGFYNALLEQNYDGSWSEILFEEDE